MALAAGLHGAVRLSFCKAGKVDQFGANFKVRILADNEVVRPFKKISGKVVIESRFPLKHKGILIQFEGICTLRYATKLDNRTTFHQGRNCILENTKPEVEGFQESNIKDILVAESDTVLFISNSGCYTYPFTLEIPGDPHLPAPFKNSLGNLVYRLTVYMKSSNGIMVEVGDKSMRFAGHHNLLNNIEAVRPISVEKSYKKSVFNRKKLAEVVFSTDTSGFLPEEDIPFILYVKNQKCIPLQLTVQLVQQFKYDTGQRVDSAKRKFYIIATKEKDEFEPQPESTWVDKLTVPTAQEPSYSEHFMYNVIYSLQCKVKMLDAGTIKGEAPVYVGTTRDPQVVLMTNAQCLEVNFPGMIRRRGSASSARSVRSHSSTVSTMSLPPAYSQLSSRIPSWETLPPSYDEVEQFGSTSELTLEVPSIMSPTDEDEGEEGES